MRKKDLFNQNVALFAQLEKSKLENDRLSKELSKCKKELSAALTELRTLKNSEVNGGKGFVVNTEIDVFTPDKLIPVDITKDIEETQLNDEFKHGSKAIGKIVMESAKCSDELLKADEETKKSLSNLIVCKSEFAKSEILAICNSEAPIETKYAMIDAQVTDAVDYFKSVIGQLNS